MYKTLTIPPRVGGNFLDEPIERRQVSLQYYKMFEQINDNFTNSFDNNGNLILQDYATTERPTNPTNYLTVIDTTLGLPIWFDGTNWKDFAGNIV